MALHDVAPLHLLRELLSDDGVIFVSIDDNEQHHLRMLMDEIFGKKSSLPNSFGKRGPELMTHKTTSP